MNRILTLVILCAFSVQVSGQTGSRFLRSDWVQETGGVTAALSKEGRCVAVATSSSVAVIDKTGRELWRWNFSQGNRYIVATKIAVAPRCDWLALAGNAGYRYVWIAHRSGKRLSIRTEGTPLAVAISHSGELVAVGTGAGTTSLYSADGSLRWKNDVAVAVPIAELSFSEDDRAVMIQSWGQSVISMDGKTLWAGGVWGVGSGRPAGDFRTFVAWGEPPHGPGIGTVALIDGSGKTLWQRHASSPAAIISRAGDLVVARTTDQRDITEAESFIDNRPPDALRLISSDGSVVRTFAIEGDPLAFATAGRRFLIRTESDLLALDLEGNVVWSIPLPDRFQTTILTTGDLQDLVLLHMGQLKWFSAP